MARLFHRARRAPKPRLLASDAYVDSLAQEFHLDVPQVLTIIRSVGFDTEKVPSDLVDLLREVIACKLHEIDRFKSDDPSYEASLDAVIREFDEIYVDTAPIIQMDWFLHFVADVRPILRRRKKKLIILEKTMEELHGLKDNKEKDRDVRVRATIRPDLIRWLAKQGLVRIGDTGSQGIADDHLVKLFGKIGANENVLLITQDRGLSERIINVGHAFFEKGPVPQKQTFWEKLTRKPVVYAKPHLMAVCKLTEGGRLKRCYICPYCKESYYDEFSVADGMLPDSHCTILHNEEMAKEQAEAARKAEQERRRAEEAARPTVGKRLERRRVHALHLLVIALACLVICLSALILSLS